MTTTDPYKMLGVEREASADEIKTAYRSLAKLHHPDVSKAAGAEDRFKEINTAYQILSDPNAKWKWDRYEERPDHDVRKDWEGDTPFRAWGQSQGPAEKREAGSEGNEARWKASGRDVTRWADSRPKEPDPGPQGSFGAHGAMGPGSDW